MDTVFTVIGLALTLLHMGKLYVLSPFSNCKYKYRLVRQLKLSSYLSFVECANADAVQSHLNSFEKHTLGSNAKVYIHPLILRCC